MDDVGVVTEETLRQVVILVFTVIGTVTVLWITATASNEMELRIIQMRTALVVKRFADSRAEWWGKIARSAATYYQRKRLT